MIGVKKFFFFVCGLAVVVLGGVAIFLLNSPQAEPVAAIIPGFFCLIFLLGMLKLRSDTKCPHCNKVWVGKKIGDEDLGACSNTFTKKEGDTYHTYEKHRHRESYKCISCGNEWQKTVEKDKRLN